MPDDPDEAMLWMAGLAAEGVEQQAEKRAVAPDTAVEEPAPATGQAPEETAGETVIEARHALAAGNVAAAVKIYRQHLDRGPGDLALLEELENAVAGTPDEPELLTLLGDAYMQNGQVQQALEAYRKGLA
jgi:Flp pilus assembly protein TadD